MKRKDEAVTKGEFTPKTNVVPKCKKSNSLSTTSEDVIILGSSSDDETGLDLGSNFDLQKVKLEPVDSFEMKNVDEIKTKKKGVKDDKMKHKDDKTKHKDDKMKHKDDKTKHKDDKMKHSKDKTPNIQELKYSMNKEGKYLCPKCDKPFSTKYNMFKHVGEKICTKKLEEREAKYKCRIEGCGIQCHTKSAARCHELGTHFDVKEYFCPEPGCGKAFTHLSSLVNHKHSTHFDVYGAPGSSSASHTAPVAASSSQSTNVKMKKKKHKKSKDKDKRKKIPSFSSPDEDDDN